MLQPDIIGDSYGTNIMRSQHSVAWRNYSSLAAFLLLLLDHAFFFSAEVKYIWRSNNRLSKWLFIFSRYVPLCVLIVNYTFVHKWLLHSPVSTMHCQAWFWLLGMALSVSVIVMDTILLLRVYALYLKNYKVLLLAVPLLAEHIVAQVLMGRSTFVNPSFSEYCDLYETPIIVLPLGALTLVSHLALWFAIYKKRKASQAAVLSLVVKESHLTLIVFSVPVFCFIPWSFHARTNPFIIFVWPITFVSITSCRIVLNMLRLKIESPRTNTTSMTDFLFSTILDSRTRNSDELTSTQHSPNEIGSSHNSDK